MNIDQVRKLFPVTKEAIYLNNAYQCPLNTLVNDRLNLFLNSALNPVGKIPFNRNDTRTLLAKLLGGEPSEYALVTSSGVGIGIVAQGIDFNKGDNVVIPEYEHQNNTYPWLQLAKKGVEIRFVKLCDDNSIDPAAIEKLVDEKTRVVAIAAVRYNSGFRPNLAEIAKIAHKKNALFMVDAAQAAGIVPINIERDQIDIMAGCGFKWLLGMHGTGFLYVKKRVINMIDPVLPGMFSVDMNLETLHFYEDSRKFETGTIAYSLFDAWSAGLELLIETGIENIYQQALENSDLVIEGILKKGFSLVTPNKNREERSAIVLFNIGSFENTKALFEKLTAQKVLLTLQGKNIRVSPNFFNTKEEINIFLDLI